MIATVNQGEFRAQHCVCCPTAGSGKSKSFFTLRKSCVKVGRNGSKCLDMVVRNLPRARHGRTWSQSAAVKQRFCTQTLVESQGLASPSLITGFSTSLEKRIDESDQQPCFCLKAQCSKRSKPFNHCSARLNIILGFAIHYDAFDFILTVT